MPESGSTTLSDQTSKTDRQPQPLVAEPLAWLNGRKVALVGQLARLTREEAQQLVRAQGGIWQEQCLASTQLVLLGEADLPLPVDAPFAAWIDDALRQRLESGQAELLPESQFRQRLGLADAQPEIHQLYTAGLLAELIGVPVSTIRRWQRLGLIRPQREVRRLAYFDFAEVAAARRLAELLASGMSPAAIERQLRALARWLPQADRSLAQLSVIVQGRRILLRQGDGLVDARGQRHFDFDALREEVDQADTTETRHRGPIAPDEAPPDGASAASSTPPATVAELLQAAAELEDEGQLAAATEMYRAALAAGGPRAETCFHLADLLYRQKQTAAALERLYMAVELDEDFVEARANLGCLLAELGQPQLAAAALAGALRFHPEYADAHYHLARVLEDSGQADEAATHWQAFLELSPDSPWSDAARARLDRYRAAHCAGVEPSAETATGPHDEPEPR